MKLIHNMSWVSSLAVLLISAQTLAQTSSSDPKEPERKDPSTQSGDASKNSPTGPAHNTISQQRHAKAKLRKKNNSYKGTLPHTETAPDTNVPDTTNPMPPTNP